MRIDMSPNTSHQRDHYLLPIHVVLLRPARQRFPDTPSLSKTLKHKPRCYSVLAYQYLLHCLFDAYDHRHCIFDNKKLSVTETQALFTRIARFSLRRSFNRTMSAPGSTISRQVT